MIDLFRTWLPQIIGYAAALQNGTIRKSWADGDRSKTSVYYSGELYEQVFEDLHPDSMLSEARHSLGEQSALVKCLDEFLCSLKRLDDWIEAHVDTNEWGKGEIIPATVGSIFNSQEWSDASTAAGTLVVTAERAGFRAKDADPQQTLH